MSHSLGVPGATSEGPPVDCGAQPADQYAVAHARWLARPKAGLPDRDVASSPLSHGRHAGGGGSSILTRIPTVAGLEPDPLLDHDDFQSWFVQFIPHPHIAELCFAHRLVVRRQ
jgi:hypothetical protein